MKIVFSRKGFDSGSGGCPSPIFPDGRLLSLPIPHKYSPIAYKNIFFDEFNVGEIVESLTKGKRPSHHFAHLDPDINPASISRHPDWQPIFGQSGIAQKHLINQGVSAGDLLLFFGLFQEIIVENGKFTFNSKTSPKHVIWGWFQIEKGIPVDQIDKKKFDWAMYHPHFHGKAEDFNTIYIAKKNLDFPQLSDKSISGAGIFPFFVDKLQLTAPDSSSSLWKLPLCMSPRNGVSQLSYHKKLERWEMFDDYVLLQTVGRGQEFVFDSLDYPEAIDWIGNLFI